MYRKSFHSFQNIVFTSLITDGRTNGQVDNIMPAASLNWRMYKQQEKMNNKDICLKHLEFKIFKNISLVFEFLLFTVVLQHDGGLLFTIHRDVFHTSASF